jgi:hypothetical protein
LQLAVGCVAVEEVRHKFGGWAVDLRLGINSGVPCLLEHAVLDVAHVVVNSDNNRAGNGVAWDVVPTNIDYPVHQVISEKGAALGVGRCSRDMSPEVRRQAVLYDGGDMLLSIGVLHAIEADGSFEISFALKPKS